MVEEEIDEESKDNNNRNKRKRVIKQQQQIVLSTSTTTQEKIKEETKPFSNLPTYTIKKTGRKNGKTSAIQIIPDVKIHHFWGNIFRRKFEMHAHFSEAAFGSDSDKKMEFRNLWEDIAYKKKYFPQDYLDTDTENELKK